MLTAVAPVKAKQTTMPSSTVEVTAIPKSMAHDTLMMLLENKRSGGGEVKDLQYTDGKGRAVVTFDDPEGWSIILLFFYDSVRFAKIKLPAVTNNVVICKMVCV